MGLFSCFSLHTLDQIIGEESAEKIRIWEKGEKPPKDFEEFRDRAYRDMGEREEKGEEKGESAFSGGYTVELEKLLGYVI